LRRTNGWGLSRWGGGGEGGRGPRAGSARELSPALRGSSRRGLAGVGDPGQAVMAAGLLACGVD
jgi:hypothetical protein